MQIPDKIVQDLVLIGGGHSHSIVLRMFAMQPLPGVRLTLISEAADTPYSGMIPGYLAGLYDRRDCYIDLRQLCRFAQAQFYVDRVIGLDLEQHRVLCVEHPPVRFDWLSLDTGSTPLLPSALQRLDFGGRSIAVKPIRQFLERWHDLLGQLTKNPLPSLHLGIVGGGAGGVELTLAIAQRLRQIRPVVAAELVIHLFHRDATVLTGYNPFVQRQADRVLQAAGIQVHPSCDIQTGQIHDRPTQPLEVVAQTGEHWHLDYLFWTTQAAAPDWLKGTGLELDSDGFILVQDSLQSTNQPRVFAAGDVATMQNYPRPKAGVFAVRQGKPLFRNLRRAIRDQPLIAHQPQSRFLSLLSTGDRRAIAAYGPLGWYSPLLWQWKDRIDRQFMARFQNLPVMTQGSSLSPPPCAGCASKVGRSILANSLARLLAEFPQPPDPSVLVGLENPDDAAVIQIPTGEVLVQTVDYFRVLVNDPFVFGQIAAHHCLSDLYAMGATPQTAQAIVTLPYGNADCLAETLYQLLAGACKVLQASGASLVGGHTVEGGELAFGLTCNGCARADRLLPKRGLQPDQGLILTKPIGTGTLFAAEMQQRANHPWIDGAIAMMLQSNRAAAACFLRHGATACTDITGFGLAGHLAEMVSSSACSVWLSLHSIPSLPGAIATLTQGIVSSLHAQNLQMQSTIAVEDDRLRQTPQWSLLFDPQTSGGLLAAVPLDRVSACLHDLHNAGYCHAAAIGKTQVGSGAIWLVP